MQEPHTPRNGNLNEINIKWRRIKERWRRNTSSKLTWKPPTPPIRFGFVVRRHLRTWKPICQESDAHASHTDTTHTNDTQCMKTGNMVTVLSWMENGEKRETNKNIIDAEIELTSKKVSTVYTFCGGINFSLAHSMECMPQNHAYLDVNDPYVMWSCPASFRSLAANIQKGACINTILNEWMCLSTSTRWRKISGCEHALCTRSGPEK